MWNADMLRCPSMWSPQLNRSVYSAAEQGCNVQKAVGFLTTGWPSNVQADSMHRTRKVRSSFRSSFGVPSWASERPATCTVARSPLMQAPTAATMRSRTATMTAPPASWHADISSVPAPSAKGMSSTSSLYLRTSQSPKYVWKRCALAPSSVATARTTWPTRGRDRTWLLAQLVLPPQEGGRGRNAP